MVEITYQMVLSTLQTAGLLVGIFYYIMTLAYTRRNQEETLKTRKAVLYHQTMGQLLMNNEALKHILHVQNNPFSSVEEYLELRKDPDYILSTVYLRNLFEQIGSYCKHGLVDLEMFADTAPWFSHWFWDMSKEAIYDTRTRRGPSFFRNAEYMMNALEKYWKEHPETAP
jgi:hypothetical protein